MHPYLINSRARWWKSAARGVPAVVFSCSLTAQVFLADDPLWKEPPPVSVGKVAPVKLDNLVDFYKNTFRTKGERHRPGKVIPSMGVNTLGEVPDSAWYTNRHRTQRMTIAELAAGPDHTGPPLASGKWTITSAKSEGVTPGFTIKDANGHRYLLKFDPHSNPELATGADSVGSKFFYAAGYNVPENYPIRFQRDQLAIGDDVEFTDHTGRKRKLENDDVADLLKLVPSYSDGSYRALASFYIPGEPVGPYKYYRRRADDPNELAPHEHLRVLRGLYVFAAWLNHTDAKSLNSLDLVVEEAGRRFVKHYLIDFGASLGSDSLYAKDPRLGHEYFLAAKPGAIQLATLGLYVPRYARVSYPDDRAVGNFDSEAFDPDRWKSNYPNAAFENRLPGDEFWAAKQVMAFSDDEIRAMVRSGNYSNPDTARVISDILIQRRDAIGKTFFAKLLPLDNMRIDGTRLAFDDLAVKYNFVSTASYQIGWSRFDNKGSKPAPGSFAPSGPELPGEAAGAPVGAYWAAHIEDPVRKLAVTVFVRKDAARWTVVGIERQGENAWVPR